MDLIFNCPKCGQELEVDDSGAGEEIDCPSCSSKIHIPGPATPVAAPDGAEPAPAGGWAPGGQHGGTINSSAAAKVVMHLKVPTHSTPSANLISKPLVPLDAATKETDRHL